MNARNSFKPENAITIQDKRCSAFAWVGSSRIGSAGFVAVGFSGKREKPDFNYLYRTNEQAFAKVREHAAAVLSSETYKAERAAQRKAERCLTPEDVWNKARSSNYLSAADTAVCLRAQLAKHFPAVKFSVTSSNYSMGCSISIRWTDGPTWPEVNDIAQNYSFAGFDGSIDLKYSQDRWLARDGSMSLAHSEGTTGSRGSCRESLGDPHAPDCVLVRHGADYVSTSREISFPLKCELTRKVCAHFGVECPETFADARALESFLNTRAADDYLCQWVYRAGTGALKLAA